MNKKIVLPAIAIVSLLLLSPLVMAQEFEDSSEKGWSSVEIIPDELEEQNRRNTQTYFLRKAAQSCPVPEIGKLKMVTYVPNTEKGRIQKHSYLTVSILASESQLENEMKTFGFGLISCRTTGLGWQFCKWKYYGANAPWIGKTITV